MKDEKILKTRSIKTAESILEVLREQKITKEEDLLKASGNNKILTGNGETSPWMETVFSLVKDNLVNSTRELQFDGKKYITFGKDSADIIKYCCMFPQTTINLSGHFVLQSTAKDYYDLPIEYLKALLRHKELIRLGVYQLLPESVSVSDADNFSDWDAFDAGKVFTLSGQYDLLYGRTTHNETRVESIDVIDSNGTYLANEMVEKLYFSFPWLYGASVEDYIDIVEKNRMLYNHYCNTILRFTEGIYTGDFRELKREVDEASISIKIEMEKAKDQLFRKGVLAVVSMGFAFIPLMASLSNEQKLLLSSFLGATSLKEVISIFSEDLMNIKTIGIDSPFWLTYAWERKVKPEHYKATFFDSFSH